MKHWAMYIGGQWEQALSSATYETINPANGQAVGTAPYGGRADAERAVAAAAAAFPAWSKRPAKERAELLHRIAARMTEASEELAELITLEMGKPLAEARGEVKIAIDYLKWNAEEAVRAYGKVIPASVEGKRLLTIRQPVGPVGAITPWNFPLSMAARKLGPALAAGCTVVFKPAPQTPGAALKLAELAEREGLPPGVLNVVTGDAEEIGGVLLNHPAIRKITFTGSTAVGKKLLRGAADQVKKMSMELGGHAPFIVFEDADLDEAVRGAMASKFRNAGQTCICANRIYVQESIAAAFTDKLKSAVERLVVGDGRDPRTELGPVIDARALEKAERHVRDAVAKGAQVVTGGGRKTDTPGFFFEPTVLTGATPDMQVMREETFGPVAPIASFRTEEEAIAMANDTPYGLAAYFYTRDLSRMFRVHEALEYGIVGCNDAVPTTVQGPFGGVKESGIGREGGPDSVADYLETKFVSIQIEETGARA
ncbi:NAD-dependent succinate-semialdehyde dehydrogenase [Cohnella cellulosilytica]|uniref:NAD-dependent succinate-semialdehyde dehydrogenase n=1 Tax=Cohnella cellulosilytica TaxID=986710 RepID=A0ABW2F5C8_9BACL